ncbi:MAG TPA: dihydropteroate synthase [Tepidiformaceae bacterium]|nr:dihydropteroate synthase [Tepidiformaceae bacterium]
MAYPADPLRRRYTVPALDLRGRRFAWGERTYVCAVVNVTPDSFSGDGLGSDPEAAARAARAAEAEGADLVDIGAESSRPGAPELDPTEELRRLMPCLEAVRAATSLPVSVDTYHASVADAALAAGADAINDIHGLRHDAAMAGVVARHGAALIAMHNQRGRPHRETMADIAAGFAATLALADAAGVPRSRIILDPGFGFGWKPEQNLEMVRRLAELGSFELPLLLGPSRKSTIGFILGLPVDQRVEGTAALVALGIAGGADIVRVHDVRAMARVASVADATVRAHWRHEPAAATPVVLALGSNMGDRAGNLRRAVALLEARGVTVARRSSIWETPPVPADQPPFLNAAVAGETTLTARELLTVAKAIEAELGRVPGPRWGPRPIDIDILFHGPGRTDEPDLQVPHALLAERGFVLVPLAEVTDGPLPVLGETAAALLERVSREGIVRTGEAL